MRIERYQVIQRPIITEKTNLQNTEMNQVVFAVHPKATKHQIKAAVEELFKVKVTEVRTLNVRGKSRRLGRLFLKKPNWKKAVVTLAEGDTIDFYENV